MRVSFFFFFLSHHSFRGKRMWRELTFFFPSQAISNKVYKDSFFFLFFVSIGRGSVPLLLSSLIPPTYSTRQAREATFPSASSAALKKNVSSLSLRAQERSTIFVSSFTLLFLLQCPA